MSKRPISATIDEGLIAWIDNSVKGDSRYRNKSHLVETALELMRASQEKRRANR